jgi:hypothetical protein
MPGFHVESSDHQVAGHQEGVGDRVIWRAKISGDLYEQMGAETPLEATGEAIIHGNKIKSRVPSLK